MSSVSYSATRPPLRERLAYQLRVLRVMAAVEFKMKYVDSALGYVWSLAKPLAYFGVLSIVFGRFFKTNIEHFSVYLLLGIVMFTFLVDTVGTTLPSIVTSGVMLRRIAFPPLVIPVAATVTGALTFCMNLVAVAIFVGISGISPRLEWLYLLPLLLELYAFTLGLGLIVATLFVRFRDIAPLWELVAQLTLFASPIMYPISILPGWAERVVTLNPFVQVVQDVRDVVLGSHSTVAGVLGSQERRLVPIGIAVATLLVGLWLYRRDAPRFAERA